MAELAKWLQRCPLVAILRGVRPDEIEEIGVVLVEAGFAIIEVPLNSPAPLDSIRRLVKHCGERALIGAGTVTKKRQVTDIADAGGRLIVMPHGDRVVIRQAKAMGLIALPGFATPTEAFAALAVLHPIEWRAMCRPAPPGLASAPPSTSPEWTPLK